MSTQTFYYYDDDSRTVYHHDELVEDRPDLIFLGSSMNPNKQMTVAVMFQGRELGAVGKIRPLF